jgi:sarcosine oxidase delta subunit
VRTQCNGTTRRLDLGLGLCRRGGGGGGAMCCLAKLRTEERISLASQDNQLADDRRHRTHAKPSHHLPHRIPCRKGYRVARDTVSQGIPCRKGHRVARDTVSQRIPCRKGHRVARDPQVPKNCGAVQLMPRCVRACVRVRLFYVIIIRGSAAVSGPAASSPPRSARPAR